MIKAGVLRAALAACLLSGVTAVEAAAATGDLIQKPGAAGCLSVIGFCLPGTGLDGPSSATVSPDGQTVYVASEISNAVAVFDRAADGTLTQKRGPAGCISDTGAGRCSDGAELGGPASVTVSPDGQSAYVAAALSDAVAVFDRAPNGRLTQKPGAAGCISDTGAGPCVDGTALDGAIAVTLSPDGKNAYVASGRSDAVAVFDRAADGTLTQKPGTAGCISDTGAGPCVNGAALDAALDVALSLDGKSAYVPSAFSSAVAVFDRAADGTLTQKRGEAGCISDTGSGRCGDGTTLDGAQAVTVSPDGKSAYVGSANDGVTMFDRGPKGRLTQKPGAAGCISDTGAGPCADGRALESPTSLTVSPDGQSAYIASANDGVTMFDRAPNGTLAQKPGTAGCISDTGAGPCVDGTALDGAQAVTVSPDGKSTYVASFFSDAVAVFDREPISPPRRDTTNPVVGDLEISPPRVAARVGANVSYRLSEPATVRFTVERALPGRRVGGRCVKPKRSNRHAQRCTRHQALRGSFTHRDKAGQNSFTFSGRLRARQLQPGLYRLRVVATDRAANKSRPRRDRFRIVRP
jgi:DNA-binding beta-propeller fold protein YncE